MCNDNRMFSGDNHGVRSVYSVNASGEYADMPRAILFAGDIYYFEINERAFRTSDPVTLSLYYVRRPAGFDLDKVVE